MHSTVMMTQEEIMLGNAAFTSKLNVVHHAYVDICGDMVAGALLSQILYWFGADRNGRPRARIQKDGYLWIAKARGDWWHEIRISPKQYDRAVKILQRCGFVELRTMKFNGNPTTHIRIISETLNQAIDNWKYQQALEHMERERQKLMAVGFSPFGDNETYQRGTPEYTNGEQGFQPMGQAELPNGGTSLTEITTENKKENIAENTRTSKEACELLSFNDVWEHYPKKTGRSKAQSAYEKALAKGANGFVIWVEVVLFNQHIQNAIERQATEWRYVPTGGTWFDESRWEDVTPLIGKYLDYDHGIEYMRQVKEMRRLATLAGESDQSGKQKALEKIKHLIAAMPY